jgi:hypothetical protein
MCFCFDGEHALVAYQPDECRQAKPAEAAASQPAERKALSTVQRRRRQGDAFAGRDSEAVYPL